ncbi:MarR family winged helix-turn-helix transcriptional regulator [Dinoroseobacter sp. S124A]|uniref:MarR family winged helix-turn-helix transcriptional regulator n=1 Tax=Dinoroseobacter sp. S124A TaxID=3415128 RepID=UPI003C7D854C
MAEEQWTEAGAAVTTLILDVFRLSGRLQLEGDRLVEGLGLTSARWQILGAIAYADQPESVAWHARTMGVHRQGVQRIVNELKKEEIVAFRPNPHHKRAQLVVLTPKGQKLFADAVALQVPWVNEISEGMSAEDIATTLKVIGTLKKRLLEKSNAQDSPPS